MICKHLHRSWDLSGGLGQGNRSENLTFVSTPPLFSPVSYGFRSLRFLFIVIDKKVKGSDCVSGDSPIRFPYFFSSNSIISSGLFLV